MEFLLFFAHHKYMIEVQDVQNSVEEIQDFFSFAHSS